MKRIKNIAELQSEKRKLVQQQRFLKKQMEEDWIELKRSVKPSGAGAAIGTVLGSAASAMVNQPAVWRSLASAGAEILARKLVSKAGSRLGSFFGKKRK